MKLNIVVENLTSHVIPLSWVESTYRLSAGQRVTFPLEKTSLCCGGSKMNAGRQALQDLVSSRKVSVTIETDFPVTDVDMSKDWEVPVVPSVRTDAKTVADIQVSLDDAERLRRIKGVNPTSVVTLIQQGKGRLSPAPGTDLEDAGQRVIDISGGRSISQAIRKAEVNANIQGAVNEALLNSPKSIPVSPPAYRVRETVIGD